MWRGFGIDTILTLITVLLVREVSDDEDEDPGSDGTHRQVRLGVKLRVDEARERCGLSQPVVRILPTHDDRCSLQVKLLLQSIDKTLGFSLSRARGRTKPSLQTHRSSSCVSLVEGN